MHSHVSVVHNGQRSYIQETTFETCQTLINTGTILLGNNILFTGIKANTTTSQALPSPDPSVRTDDAMERNSPTRTIHGTTPWCKPSYEYPSGHFKCQSSTPTTKSFCHPESDARLPTEDAMTPTEQRLTGEHCLLIAAILTTMTRFTREPHIS